MISGYDVLRKVYRRLRPAPLPSSWQVPFDEPTRTELPYFEEAFKEESVPELWAVLREYESELAALPSSLFLNSYFGPADVAFYYTTIRTSRPQTIIEVGSGFSTKVARLAVKKNGVGSITCIDPEPRASLVNLGVTHLKTQVQDVDPKVFDVLKAGDVLFIDSSHEGDEVRHHHKFLDRLPSGVHVHYHDIDYPWPRPEAAWTEDAIVHEFIQKRGWDVRVFGSALTRRHLSEMRAVIPNYSKTPYRRYNAVWFVSR